MARFKPYGPCPACSSIAFDAKTGKTVSHNVKYFPAKTVGWLKRLVGRKSHQGYLQVECIVCGYTYREYTPV